MAKERELENKGRNLEQEKTTLKKDVPVEAGIEEEKDEEPTPYEEPPRNKQRARKSEAEQLRKNNNSSYSMKNAEAKKRRFRPRFPGCCNCSTR